MVLAVRLILTNDYGIVQSKWWKLLNITPFFRADKFAQQILVSISEASQVVMKKKDLIDVLKNYHDDLDVMIEIIDINNADSIMTSEPDQDIEISSSNGKLYIGGYGTPFKD